jgi:hypothetical protein
MMPVTKDGKKVNLTLTGLWEKRGGIFMSPPLGQLQFDAFQQVEPGGRILFKITPSEYRVGNERVPEASIEYMTKEETEAFFAKNGKGGYASKQSASVEEDTI